jgi:Zn-dependent protease with chaperone function
MRWMRHGSLVALALAAGTALVSGAAALAAFRSRRAQIPAFLVAWNALRLTGAAQVVLQGGLAFALSFWVTAYFFEFYSVKLVLIVAVVALASVAMVVRAIFARVDPVTEVDGVPLAEADAPALWQRLRELAEQVGTAPPARVFAGIDDNFYVTEAPQLAGGERHEGRALYVSLSLLRFLGREEAEAILCHELAHFSGGDTAHSQRLAPALARYGRYVQGLAESPAGWPMLPAMRAFQFLFTWAMHQTGRERELRADRIAAEHTSPRAMATALLRVAAYSSYRHEVERTLFEQDDALASIGISERVREGFATFATRSDLAERLGTVPHPLDTHPANEVRFEALGVALPATRWSEVLADAPADSWYARLPTASALEQTMWSAYESTFAARHELRRAYETTPTTEEGLALVTKHFPPVEIQGREGAQVALVDWRGVHVEGRGLVPFETMRKAEVVERTFRGKRLEVDGEVLIRLDHLAQPDAFLEAFNRYWGRAQVAERAGVERAMRAAKVGDAAAP